jgi:hypothetical protein
LALPQWKVRDGAIEVAYLFNSHGDCVSLGWSKGWFEGLGAPISLSYASMQCILVCGKGKGQVGFIAVAWLHHTSSVYTYSAAFFTNGWKIMHRNKANFSCI